MTYPRDIPRKEPSMSEDSKPHKTNAERWSEKTAYSKNWNGRNQALLKLLDDNCAVAASLSFTEYGCGPYTPFKQAVTESKYKSRIVHLADRISWGDKRHIVDFNAPKGPAVIPSDTAVLSGVIEYINDVPLLFDTLSRHHRYILFSYATRQSKRDIAEVADAVSEVHERATTHGWRNHYTFDEILQLATTGTFPGAVSQWQDQLLFYAISKV